MGRPKSNEKLVPVMVRLAAAEVERIDAEREDRSRSDYVRSMLTKSSVEGGSSPQTDAPSADPSSGGADVQRLATPTGEAPASPPSAPPDPPEYPMPGYPVWPAPDPSHHGVPLEQEAPVDVDAIGLRWLKSKTTREVRAIGDPWGPAIRAEVRRWAEAFGAPPAPAEKPQRRQGTVTRPADRAKAVGVTLPGPGYRPPGSIGYLGKRHADDCSCLSCVPPKAAAK